MDSALASAAEELRPALLVCARRLTRSRSDAEDLVQETYLRFAASGSGLRDHGRLRAWLMVVLKNSRRALPPVIESYTEDLPQDLPGLTAQGGTRLDMHRQREAYI